MPIIVGNLLLYWLIPIIMMLAIGVFVMAIQLNPELSTSMLEQVRSVMLQLESMIFLTMYLLISTVVCYTVVVFYRIHQKSKFFKRCDDELFAITDTKKSKQIVKNINLFKQVGEWFKDKWQRFLEWLI
jgi:hypothetical protein